MALLIITLPILAPIQQLAVIATTVPLSPAIPPQEAKQTPAMDTEAGEIIKLYPAQYLYAKSHY